MKINVILFSIFIAVLTRQVKASCQCPEGDTACLQNCVDITNTCIASCGSNTECYNGCIQESWPGQGSTTVSNNVVTATVSNSVIATTISQMKSNPTTAVATASITKIITAPTLSSSVPAVHSSMPSSASIPGGSTTVSTTPVTASQRPIPTYPEFSPKPPTSSTAPPPTSSSGSKSFLIPGVAIGVATVTVIIQLFFLGRMGTVLFHS